MRPPPTSPHAAPAAWRDSSPGPSSRSSSAALLIFWLTRPDEPDDVATGPTSPSLTQTATDQATTDAPESPTQSPTESPTETPSESPTTATPATIELPGSAEQCSSVGGLTVYKGNSATSCPFAENVARAFAAMDPPPEDEVTLTDVSSPVTGKDYTLTCSYTAPVRCAGGNNAVIFLASS